MVSRGSLGVLSHPKRPDWYVVPRQWLPEVGNCPVVELLPNGIGIHRSLLPILAPNHQEAQAVLAGLSQQQIAAAIERGAFDAQSEPLGWKLRSYQHETREFVLQRRGALMALAMRTGKTLTAIASHDPSLGPLVIVAPLQTRAVWLKEIKRRWPEAEPIVLTGRKFDPSALEGPPLIFTHYDVLAGWQCFGTRLRIGTLVLDEAHLLSNRKSKRSTAAIMLSARAERVLALTGTPLWNRPAGLWTILACVAPGAFGKYHDCAERYADPQTTAYGTTYNGTSNEDEFRLRLTEIMIRRSWSDIRSELPPISRNVEIAEVTEDQAFKLERLVEAAREAENQRTVVGEIARLRRLLGRIKTEPGIEAASRVLETGEPVVVWAWHQSVADHITEKLQDRGYSAYCVTGGSDADVREACMAAWKGEAAAALVLTISVGQVGIDLSHAAHEVFVEQDWTPANVAQAEMRTFSPDRPMSVTYIVADHPVDRSLVEALERKCAMAASIGVPAAESAIDVIAASFQVAPESPDMNRLMSALLAIDSDDSE